MRAARTFWRPIPGTRSLEFVSGPGCFTPNARAVVEFRDDAAFDHAVERLLQDAAVGEAPDA